VKVDAGADFGDVMAAAVEAEVDGEEVFGGQLVDPFDVEGLVGVGIDERGNGCGGWGVKVGVGP
jgi:hypothetical protein